MKEEQRVFLIPTVISEEAIQEIPASAINILQSIQYIITERARTTRRFIKKLIPTRVISDINILEIDKHDPNSIIPEFKSWIKAGHNIGIMSESGIPCVADPGNILVTMAHQLDLRVVPLTGPSSIILALSGSGLNGQQFSFHGYLPVKEPAIQKKLNLILQKAKLGETQIFIETPFRNQRMFDMLIKTVPEQIKLCVAMDLTGKEEFIKTKTIKAWRQNRIKLSKLPCIYLLGS